MTRDDFAAEVDDILRDGGRLSVLRRLIVKAADSYAAAEAERICRPSRVDLEQAWALATGKRRKLSNSERETS